MKIQDILLIALVIGLVCLPAVLLAVLLRAAPIYSLVQRNRSWRPAIVLGNGLLCFGVIYLALVWLASAVIYGIADFYFDTTLGLVPGITRANVEQFKWTAINEMWLRQVVPGGPGQTCLSGNTTACRLADMAGKIGSLDSILWFLVGLAVIATLVNLWLSWRFTRPSKLKPG